MSFFSRFIIYLNLTEYSTNIVICFNLIFFSRRADASAGFPRAQRSFLSCILYLNTVLPEAGGETRFLHPRDETEPVVVHPRAGAALLFDQVSYYFRSYDWILH